MAQNQQQQDTSSDIMWGVGAIIVLVVCIGYFFGHKIAYYYLLLKLLELKLLYTILPLHFFEQYIYIIQHKSVDSWTLDQLSFIGDKIGRFTNIPFIVILGYFTYRVWKQNPSQRFKRILTMKSLKQSEQKIWPYIAPVVDVDFMSQSFDKGPYAMGLRPYDFAIKYHLLSEPKNVNSLDRKKSEKLFISQLGKPFSSFNRLKKHEQALLAIFAAHGCGDKKGAMKAINDIAISSAQKSIQKMPDFSSAKLLFKYCEDPRVQEIFKKHAYSYTIMAQMLEFARGTGVFPPSYFIWLKPKDRTLWYILNCVGRQVSFVECAGIFSHWRAEQTANHKLDVPFVTKAIDGLEKALSEIKIK